ncbi:MAG: aminotransferase class IV [Bacteroidetes bacterium]|nr:aminotransferase class IV [Bacteroidota bacterium]
MISLNGYFNDTLLPVSEIRLPVNDLLIFRGLGVFDYMRTYNRKVFLFEEHITRLFASADRMGLHHHWLFSQISQKIQNLADQSPLPESAFRVILTGGMGSHSLEPGPANLIILTEEVHPYPAIAYDKGINAKLCHYDRYRPDAKSITYSQAVLELAEAKKDGFSEVLYHNGNEISEGTTCNFFGIKDGTLITAEDGILKGTRRNFILSFAEKYCKVEMRSVQLDELSHLDEAFVTSTTREILPVTGIDHISIGNGKPGDLTQKLHSAYRSFLTV